MSAISCAIRRPQPRARARRLRPDAGVRSGQSRCRTVRHVATGTGNVTAMFARGYIEVLFKTADTPLGRELEAALARHDGVHLAAFAVADAASAHRRLAERRLPRAASRPDAAAGRHRRTARERPPSRSPASSAGEMPEGRIQILTHRTESMVWQPRWLSHPNGAHALTSIMIAVAEPSEAAARFIRFTGRQATRSACGRSIELDRGRVHLLTADCVCARAAGDPDPVAAVRRRLRDQGDVADAARRASAARRIAGTAERARPRRDLSRPSSAAARGCSRSDLARNGASAL